MGKEQVRISLPLSTSSFFLTPLRKTLISGQHDMLMEITLFYNGKERDFHEVTN